MGASLKGAALSGHGDCAKLHHETHAIHLAPMFHKLAPTDADDVDYSKGYALAGWRNAHERALLGAAPGRTDHHLIAFGENIVYCDFEVWEGAAEHGDQLFDALTITRYSGWQVFAFNEVGRKELIDQTRVSVIEGFLYQLTS
jgi:hypothetical protein